MTTDNTGSNAPAANDSAPATNPNDRGQSLPDLSDLQAELDATASEQPQKAAAHAKQSDVQDEDAVGKAETPEAGDDPFDDEERTDDDGDEEDVDDEAEDGDADEEAKAEKAKAKKSRSRRYTDRITRLEHENAELRSRTAAVSEADISAEVLRRVGAEPQEKDFPGDYLAYEKEHTAWLLDKRQVTRQVKEDANKDAQARHRQNVERVEKHKERLEDFGKSKVVKDFDKVMLGAKDAKVSPIVEDLILDSDKSGHLTFYFARNPQRLAAINAMNQRDAAREIGRIEARLSLPKPKTTTSAPTPKTNRPGGGAGSSSQDQQLDSFLNKTYGKARR